MGFFHPSFFKELTSLILVFTPALFVRTASQKWKVGDLSKALLHHSKVIYEFLQNENEHYSGSNAPSGGARSYFIKHLQVKMSTASVRKGQYFPLHLCSFPAVITWNTEME